MMTMRMRTRIVMMIVNESRDSIPLYVVLRRRSLASLPCFPFQPFSSVLFVASSPFLFPVSISSHLIKPIAYS
jgi:hypothetical protein